MKEMFTTIFLITLFFSSLYGSIINVPGDQPLIQAGINAAANGDTVLVADGIYQENISFKGKAITVASLFIIDSNSIHIDNTIINGSVPSNPDSGSVVYFCSGEDTNSVLCGFTITGGTGTRATYAQEIHRYGGGIFCSSGGKIINNIVRNNVDSANVVYAGGGGILAGWSGSEYVIIKNNTIHSNKVQAESAAGGGIAIYCKGEIIDNFIHHNNLNSTSTGPSGGGICANISSGIISGNRIQNNILDSNSGGAGGGIFAWDCGDYIIRNNLISHNKILAVTTHHGGGIAHDGLTVEIYNNIITHNEAERGAGISLWNQGNAILTNNTVTENIASLRGGGITCRNDKDIDAKNNIIWGNQAPTNSQIYQESNVTLLVTYSDIQDGWLGTGNIDADPLFAAGDSLYNLTDASLCIGKGTNTGVPQYDFDGDLRPMPVGSMADIGAQENQVATGIENISNSVPLKYTLKQNYPNPFNPKTTIEFSIPKTEFVTLKIYNILGQEMATLVSEKLSPGKYTSIWDGSGFASGIYYYKLETETFAQTRKLILLK